MTLPFLWYAQNGHLYVGEGLKSGEVIVHETVR